MTSQEILNPRNTSKYIFNFCNNIEETLLFTGNKSFLGMKDYLFEGIDFPQEHIFSQFSTNPDAVEIDQAVKRFKNNRFSKIIAVGGGSVIDFAKIFSFQYSRDVLGLESNKFEIMAIPTTAGTGSESTQFATYYIDGIKNSLDHESILPNIVLLDPKLLSTLPRNLRATTVVDAFCQCVESFWNINSTEGSRELALQGIDLFFKYSYDFCKGSNNNLLEMMQASNCSGQAINITRTTAAHSLSYPLTSRFGISHGQAVSVTLPTLLDFNCNITEGSCNDKRGIKFVKDRMNELARSFPVERQELGSELLRTHFRSLGLKIRLKDLGLSIKDLEIVLSEGFTENRMRNNPRVVSEVDAREILNEVF